MMTMAAAARALGATLQGSDMSFEAVHTDTRTLRAGDLFFALKGERFDAHDFVPQAAAAGAVGAVVNRDYDGDAGDLPLIRVADTRLALGQLAAHWRMQHKLPVVALTGSSGKTTVKEMLAAILRADARCAGADPARSVLATRGNLNNDIGVPLTLLQLTPEHRYAVVEMGMNHSGEIRYLTKLASPDIAIVNNAGRAHIEFLGSEEAIARAKGEIFEGLAAGGTAVINADDRFAPLWREFSRGKRVMEFGVEQPADVSAHYTLHETGTELTITTPHGVLQASIAAPGLHNVRNALAACAAAVALGVPSSEITAGLGQFSAVKGRLQKRSLPNGASLVDDTYNANPESMRAAIDVLRLATGRKVLVLGDMGELGPQAGQYHAEIGRCAREAGIDLVLAAGVHAELAVEAFGKGARHFASVDDLIPAARSELTAGVTMLVKGSRFMQMERVVEACMSGALS